MRNGFLGLALAALVAPAATAADDAKAILEKAAAARGDKDVRAKYKVEKATYTGDLVLMGNTYPVTGTNTTTAGKSKSEVELTIMNQALKIKQASDGTKAVVAVTVNNMDMKPPIDDAEAAELKLTAFMHEALSIDGLSDEKRFTVKLLPAEEVEKKKHPVVEVTVVPLNRTLKLYFDPDTHLVAKVSREGLIPGNKEGKQGTLETKLSEYKKTDGLTQPMKIVTTVDGADYVTVKVTEYTHLEKVDDKEFALDE